MFKQIEQIFETTGWLRIIISPLILELMSLAPIASEIKGETFNLSISLETSYKAWKIFLSKFCSEY